MCLVYKPILLILNIKLLNDFQWLLVSSPIRLSTERRTDRRTVRIRILACFVHLCYFYYFYCYYITNSNVENHLYGMVEINEYNKLNCETKIKFKWKPKKDINVLALTCMFSKKKRTNFNSNINAYIIWMYPQKQMFLVARSVDWSFTPQLWVNSTYVDMN